MQQSGLRSGPPQEPRNSRHLPLRLVTIPIAMPPNATIKTARTRRNRLTKGWYQFCCRASFLSFVFVMHDDIGAVDVKQRRLQIHRIADGDGVHVVFPQRVAC